MRIGQRNAVVALVPGRSRSAVLAVKQPVRPGPLIVVAAVAIAEAKQAWETSNVTTSGEEQLGRLKASG